MHDKPDPLVAVSLKFIQWAGADAAPQRFVWEVCRWPQWRSSEWTFVCWMIDGDGMWMQSFRSKQAAMAYFAQAPSIVMAASPSSDGSPIQGVQLHRAS